ncbi:MAG TPA: hypothetical protein V6D28_03055 [Leptolyngbyaceae cyanobacterium]
MSTDHKLFRSREPIALKTAQLKEFVCIIRDMRTMFLRSKVTFLRHFDRYNFSIQFPENIHFIVIKKYCHQISQNLSPKRS